jgi:hypothetical protein
LPENLKGRDNLKELGIDEEIILKWILEIGYEHISWNHLSQDRVQWQVLVNIVTNLQVP